MNDEHKKTFRQLSDEDQKRFLDKLSVVADRVKESFKRRVKAIAPWFEWNDYSWARLEAKIMMKTGHTPVSLQSLTMQELTGVIDEVTDSIIESIPNKAGLSIDEQKYQSAIELFKSSDLSWPQITESLGEEKHDWRPFRANVVRFAIRTNQTLPKKRGGSRRKK